MAEKIENHDFVEVDYTAMLMDGTVFDTTLEDVAKKNQIHSPKVKYVPAVVCVGEKQVVPGLDAALEGAEVGVKKEVALAPEDAFGKRDVKKMKIVPMSTFQEHKVQPHPGLQVDVDGEMGIISSVAGGRVIVNFNHPLAGKEVKYEFTVKRKVVDPVEKITSFLNTSLRIPASKIKVIVDKADKEKASVELPLQFPAQLGEVIAKKVADVTKMKEVVFTVPAKTGKAAAPEKHESHEHTHDHEGHTH